jgi:signal transduction histidine kinase
MIIESVPDGAVPDYAIADLLKSLGARALVLKLNGRKELIGITEDIPAIERRYDLREPSAFMSIVESFDTLISGGTRTVNVIGRAPLGAEFVEVVIEDRALRDAMLGYATRIGAISLAISLFTAMLVYFVLYRQIVRPVQKLSGAITHFSARPDDGSRIIKPSGRNDEIGDAEISLADMQSGLARSLKQKERLAQLGLAVSKINHDLRNMLSAAQLFSDRLSSLPDPTAQRLAPKLVSTLDRAIAFCQSTLAFGKAEERAPDLQKVALLPLAEELPELIGEPNDGIEWHIAVEPDFSVRADPEHLSRVLVNLSRNAVQALARAKIENARLDIRGLANGQSDLIEIADNGPGIPQTHRERIFQAFQGSAKSGSTGLGLSIAADLVAMQGGTLSLVDQAEGACFRISLPRQ